MKNLFMVSKIRIFSMFFCGICCGSLCAGNAGLAVVQVVSSSKVISAWVGEHPSSSYASVEAKVGAISSPGSWTHTTFTSATEYSTGTPLIITNSSGDALLVYGYYDTTNNQNLLAAVMLPSAESTWGTTHTFDSAYPISSDDYQAHIDSSGNVAVTWTTYDANAGEDHVVVATSSISTTPTWSSPTQISE